MNKRNLKNIKNIFEEKTGASLKVCKPIDVSHKVIYRRPMLVVAIMLVTALMFSIAAFAGGLIGDKRSPAGVDDVVGATDENGFSVTGKHYTFYLDFSLDSGAPAEIEDFYLPEVPDGYDLTFGMIYDGIDNGAKGLATFIWKPTADGHGITLNQYADLSEDGIRNNVISVPMGILTDGKEPSVTEVVFGNVRGYLISGSIYGEIYFVWSDGTYAYDLTVYSEDLLEGLVANLKLIENIRPYLISMTEEEINASLD